MLTITGKLIEVGFIVVSVYTVNTFDMVYTVNMVYTGDIVHTVDTVDTVDTAGRFGVHLVREISPWSSQVLCIGLVKT